MLKDLGVDYRYREYTKEPLSKEEIREVLGKLGLTARDILRSRDAKKEGLTGDEGNDALIAAMASNPNLIQRPIFVLGDKAVMGRPPDNVRQIL
ncbi:MAG: arsenate reductase (glutaredoxin) [Deltaproteobacteria bacterium]|nr:arsenate reductase (glutaredoxin) [Deltaproteobacteria bacterium]